MQKIEKKLVGTFGEIDLEIFQSFGNNKIIFNIHGVYSSKNDIRHKEFAKKIQKENLANVILFSSSRKILEFDEKLSQKENNIKKFEGKKFSNELEDSKIVLENILKNSLKYFGVEKENLEIFVNGNSLGGTIAFFLAYDFPEIKNISTVGTGLRKQKGETAILDTFPELSEYKKVLKNFSGKYLMNEGTLDNKFSNESFTEFFENIGAKEKKRIIYPGVDHPFWKINGVESEEPYNEIFLNFKKYFFENKN